MSNRSRSWRTVRIFISSTFRDMQAERDHLVRVVFPTLRERLQPHRVYLIDVDLRWGVTPEQAENDRAIDFCLDQVDECRPFFLGLLGERYGWVPTRGPSPGGSVTELEIRHSLRDGRQRPRALFAFRDPSVLDAIPEPLRSTVYAESDPEARQQMGDLKEWLRIGGQPRLDPYPCRWNERAFDPARGSLGRIAGLETFGEKVLEWLWSNLGDELQLSDETPSETTDALAEEADHHERFLEERQRVYVGRRRLQDDLLAFVASGEPIACLVSGPSGSGKSAALARLVTTLRQRHPECHVLPHFVGASPASSSLRGLLRRLCGELGRLMTLDDDIPDEAGPLVEQFRDRLWRLSSLRPHRLVLVLDALNQLESADRAHTLHWLPDRLPPNVTVIASCLDDTPLSPTLDAWHRRPHHRLTLEPLGDAERREIVCTVPSLSAKTLDAGQVERLLDNPATDNPLYLLTALEELRGFGSFERLTQRIASLPRGEAALQHLFDQVLERWEQEFDPLSVRTVLALLAASRRGLSERELRSLTDAECLYPLLRQLRPFLINRAGLLGFFHADLTRAVETRYLADREAKRACHRRLADHFAALETDSPRRVEELPWQLAEAEDWQGLAQLLADPSFFDAAWRVDSIEIKVFWARLEAASSWRLKDAYQKIVDAPAAHDPDTVGRVATLLADTGHSRQALHLRRFLVTCHRQSSDRLRLAGALSNEALACKNLGDLDGALRHLAEAEDLWRQLGDQHGLQTALGHRARVLKLLGDHDAAMALLREAELICRATGNRHGLQIALGNQAQILQARNDLDGALVLFQERERICREMGNRHGLQIVLANQALILQTRGELALALDLLHQSEVICRELGNRHGLQVVLGSQATVLHRQGRLDEAMDLLQQQEQLCRDLGNRLGLQIAWTTQALVWEAQGERRRALELLREAEEVCRELRHPEGLVLALHHQARLLVDEARDRAEEAAQLTADHGLKALAVLIESQQRWLQGSRTTTSD